MHLTKPNEERRSGSSFVIAVAALALAITGCGVDQTAREAIGSEGGVVSLESGLELQVPAGALAERTQITVREQRRQGVIEVELEPRGLELAQPARLAWGDDGSMECERESGQLLQVERNGNRAQARITRLERLRIRARQCDSGSCCSSRGQCADGGCDADGCGGGCEGQSSGCAGSCGSATCTGACDGGAGGFGGGGGPGNGNGNGNGAGSGGGRGDCTRCGDGGIG